MEKVARIETVLPVEFPSGSMKAAGARLEHHGHGSSGRKAVLCAVIRRQGAEFGDGIAGGRDAHVARSEEHTSELQSRFDLVCRLLLEKKTRKQKRIRHSGS